MSHLKITRAEMKAKATSFRAWEVPKTDSAGIDMVGSVARDFLRRRLSVGLPHALRVGDGGKDDKAMCAIHQAGSLAGPALMAKSTLHGKEGYIAFMSAVTAQVRFCSSKVSASPATNLTIRKSRLEFGFLSWITIFRGQMISVTVGVFAFAPWKVLSSASSIVSFAGSYSIVLAPIASILAADYWLVKKGKIDVPALYDPKGIYYYKYGTNWRAVVGLLFGIVPNIPCGPQHQQAYNGYAAQLIPSAERSSASNRSHPTARLPSSRAAYLSLLHRKDSIREPAPRFFELRIVQERTLRPAYSECLSCALATPHSRGFEPITMSSPALSTSTAGTARHQGPTRNKSSTNLSSHGSTTNFRSKRNKSSSSLHAVGHHGVQFAHHSKKGKRSGSHGGGARKGAIDFGFTSMPAAEDDAVTGSGEESGGEVEERPTLGDRRGSSNGSVATVRERDRRQDGRVRNREREASDEVPTSQSQEEQERSRSRSRSRGPPQDRSRSRGPPKAAKASHLPVTKAQLATSFTSTASDWESATDSPLAIGRTLPSVSPVQGVSGLGQVMGAGDALVAKEEVDEPVVTPSKPGKAKPRAFFEIDDGENDSTPPTPPSIPVAHVAPKLETTVHDTRRPANAVPASVTTVKPTPLSPAPAPTPTMGTVQPSTPSPPVSRQTTPPPSSARASVHPSTSAVPFPSTSPETSRNPTARPHTKRKTSNASIMSVSSARSFAGSSFGGLMGHPAPPGLRRSASGAVPPSLDRVTVVAGEQQSSPDQKGARRNAHQRTESMTSMRSLRSVAELAPPRRSATMGIDGGRDIAQRLRASKLNPSESSSALAALGNLGVPSRSATFGGSQTAPSSPSRRQSGYFASLRNLANLPAFTPTPSPSSSLRPSHAMPTSLNGSGTNLSKGKTRSPPSKTQTFLVSKFVEPLPSETSPLSVSPSQQPAFAGLAGRTLSSANLAGASMSRTQQKALLARDAPYWATGKPNEHGSHQSNAGKLSRNGSVVGEPQKTHKWAIGLAKEVERIEKQHGAVEKWRDPLGESLERTLEKAIKGKAKVRFLHGLAQKVNDETEMKPHSMSNTSYGKALDKARFAWLLDVVGPAMGPEGIWSPLGGTAFSFISEIPMLTPYWIEVSIVSWDDKWVYYAARFTTAPRSGSKERKLHCIGLSRSCFKMRGSRLSIPPARVLSLSGLGPDHANWNRTLSLRSKGDGKKWLKYGGAMVAKKNGREVEVVGEQGWEVDGMEVYEERRLKGLESLGGFRDGKGWENMGR
ncbi:hypothetical protein P7C70_g2276, partial [Phenoliferia sp. Uapishka_3]